MKTIQASGLLHKLQKGMKQNKCTMKEFLLMSKGREIAVQYGYKPDYYVDVILDKFNEYNG